MTKVGPVLVIGGTGHYGQRVVRSLIARQTATRVLTRSAQAARRTLGDGPELVEGDIGSKEAVSRALDRARAVVICVSAANRRLIRRRTEIERDGVLSVLKQAREARVARVVYFSGYEIRIELLRRLGILPVGEIQHEIEQTLARSSLDWTILGCAPSTELFFALLRNDKLIAPGGGPPSLPTVSPRDVGEIAAQAALRSDLSGKRFCVTGPDAMSFNQAAARLSTLLGRRIGVVKAPLAAFALAAMLTRPFNPFIHYLYGTVRLMNAFPQDLASRVPEDHRLLRDTFEYDAHSLEDDARERLPGLARS